MGLMSKLKEILFDEETVEIPVITKETKREKDESKKTTPPNRENRIDKKSLEDDDKVIIRKIETPKRETKTVKEDTLFDMPKFASDDTSSEEPTRKGKINTFTFPIFEDENDNAQETRKEKKFQPDALKQEKTSKEPKTSNRASGYTNAYDYSYGKYKGDYMSSRETNHELVAKTLGEKDEKKTFTPSPIISPVYGVLNENYKKEDIISKSEKRSPKEALDLDSVRRKAYGTLEDEIEASLIDRPIVRTEEILSEPEDVENENFESEGISIDDLLTGDADDEFIVDNKDFEVVEVPDDTELFSVLDERDSEIDIDLENTKKLDRIGLRKPELDDEVKRPLIPDDVEELRMEKTENNDSAIGEEDLFDLIDSLYEGKGEE